MNLLVTGGCGFIGSNFIRYLLKEDEWVTIFNVDALTYAGNVCSTLDFNTHERYKFFNVDIVNYNEIEDVFRRHQIDGIINFAAESHVDRSINTPIDFVDTNIGGTVHLLQLANKYKVYKYLQISTDEVYGELELNDPPFTEENKLNPRSPYSATKTSADHLVMSYVHTFGLNACITRCSNNYGPYQYPEKLIPLIITKALNNEQLPIYGNGLNIRDWIYVKDHCMAIWKAFTLGKKGEVYNIGGDSEKTNIKVVETILDILNKPRNLISYVTDRAGHDRRYAINHSKATRELFWIPNTNFETGIAKTVNWYINNQEWLETIKAKNETIHS